MIRKRTVKTINDYKFDKEINNEFKSMRVPESAERSEFMKSIGRSRIVPVNEENSKSQFQKHDKNLNLIQKKIDINESHDERSKLKSNQNPNYKSSFKSIDNLPISNQYYELGDFLTSIFY